MISILNIDKVALHRSDELVKPHSIYTASTCSDEESSSIASDDFNVESERTRSILKSSNSLSRCSNRRISFSTLEVREYPTTLGDNPGGSQGPPISLGWDHNERQTIVVPIEDYEEKRPTRRCRSELHMSEEIRMSMLMEKNEYTIRQLYKATTDAQLIRTQRRRSLENHNVYPLIWKSLTSRIRSRTRSRSNNKNIKKSI